jgi:hypothetical protein
MIQPANPIPPDLETPFAYSASGDDFHLYPLVIDPSQVAFKLVHFSGYGVALATSDERQALAQSAPVYVESALIQRIQAILGAERQAELTGVDGDPNYLDKVSALMSQYYDNVVTPLLPVIENDCDNAPAAVSKALSWVRQATLLGAIGAGDSRPLNITAYILSGMVNCFNKKYDHCMAQSTPSDAIYLFTIARQFYLLGGNDADLPNALDRASQCAGMEFFFDLDGTVQASQWLDLRNTMSHASVHNVRMRWYPLTDKDRAPGLFASAPPPAVVNDYANDCTTDCAIIPMSYDRFTTSYGPNSCSTATANENPTIYVEARPDLTGSDPKNPKVRLRYLVAGLKTEVENYGAVSPEFGCVHAKKPVDLAIVSMGFDYSGGWPNFVQVPVDAPFSFSRHATLVSGATFTENSSVHLRRTSQPLSNLLGSQ